MYYFSVTSKIQMTSLLNRFITTLAFALKLETFFSKEENKNRTSVVPLDTQSLLSSFAEFELMLYTYKFDIRALTETCLRDNENAINYAQISRYNLEINSRNTGQHGGGVGLYIKDKITYKRRQDIINMENTVEHL